MNVCLILKFFYSMKKTTLLIITIAAMLLVACATSEEQMARRAERAKQVAAALADRHYSIGVRMMHPMRGRSVQVSYGYELKVKGDTLVSHLPYFGRAYAVPYGGGKGLHFTERIIEYRSWKTRRGSTMVEILTENDEDSYFFTLEVFDNGNASFDVQMKQRDRVRFDGEMVEE